MFTKSGAGNLVLCGSVLLAVGAAAAEGSVTMAFQSADSGASSTTTIIAGPAAGVHNSPTPGALVWTQSAPLNPNYPTPPATFKTYCSEINAFATYSSVVYNEDTNVSGLLGSFADSGLGKLWLQYDAGNLSGKDATAFQLAVWNLIYDSDYTLNSGNLTATASDSAVITEANDMLAWLQANPTADSATMYVLTNESYQDQIVGFPGTGEPPPIPEPATISIGLIGAGALLLKRRK